MRVMAEKPPGRSVGLGTFVTVAVGEVPYPRRGPEPLLDSGRLPAALLRARALKKTGG